MKKIYIVFFLLVISSLKASAQTASSQSPEKLSPSTWNKEKFLQAYGHNDTLSAIINLYFRKRSNLLMRKQFSKQGLYDSIQAFHRSHRVHRNLSKELKTSDFAKSRQEPSYK